MRKYTFILSTREAEAGGFLVELGASLTSIVSSRTVRTTWRDPVSNNNITSLWKRNLCFNGCCLAKAEESLVSKRPASTEVKTSKSYFLRVGTQKLWSIGAEATSKVTANGMCLRAPHGTTCLEV